MKRKILKRLYEWKGKDGRKPLILNGARQVGKTYILREFGESEYKNTVYINFEIDNNISEYFDTTVTDFMSCH